MALAHSGHDPQIVNRTEQWLTVMAALAVGAAFFALWFWLLPGWLGFRVETAGAARWRGRRGGDGWPRFRRCWDSQLPYAAFGTSGGRDAELPRLLPHPSD
jgi:hypothetical protein